MNSQRWGALINKIALLGSSNQSILHVEQSNQPKNHLNSSVNSFITNSVTFIVTNTFNEPSEVEMLEATYLVNIKS